MMGQFRNSNTWTLGNWENALAATVKDVIPGLQTMVREWGYEESKLAVDADENPEKSPADTPVWYSVTSSLCQEKVLNVFERVPDFVHLTGRTLS